MSQNAKSFKNEASPSEKSKILSCLYRDTDLAV
jgi:hypothetical protein